MRSVFFPESALTVLRANLAKDSSAQAQAKECLKVARQWTERSDQELWSAMFGATIKRSWMVWSNGHCPSCKRSVPMYDWKMDPLHIPWKNTCPHCAEQFPKNDFGAFYESGLDVHGVFDPASADRSLLFNAEHPSPDDPLHTFGVDDGTGYFDGTNRWYFIGAFLVKGQWKQFILPGIRTLALAYALSGERIYAHKAAILLDRVADLYPSFDFLTQGLTYEKSNTIAGMGLVSVWHDACRETRDLALAFDLISPALEGDDKLVKFLTHQAARHQLSNPKDTPERIRQNIEAGILRHVLEEPRKILSNFPNTEITQIVAQTILGWPDNREQLLADLQATLEKVTAVDGLSGEKGLGGYAAIAPQLVAGVLMLFSRLDAELLPEMVRRVPALVQMFRFHADLWIAGAVVPRIGDTAGFGLLDDRYLGANFVRKPFDLEWNNLPFCSDFTLFKKLHAITGDPTFIQLLYLGNGRVITDLPHDLLEADPTTFQSEVATVIRDHGAALPVKSVNKEQWALAALRTGTGTGERAAWLDYDVGGNHGRPDAFTIGLYAHGVELLPGFGYPPVHFGGWFSPKALWYKRTAAHNTVLVDGKDQTPVRDEAETEPLAIQLNPQKGLVRGRTTAWADKPQVKLIAASGPELVSTTPMQRYERALLFVDVSADDSYVLDIFRVAGGRDHVRMLHPNFGPATVTGLELSPLPDFGDPNIQMRNFRGGTPSPGWSVDWKIVDPCGLLPAEADVHLRCTDLTTGAQAMLAETWLASKHGGANHEGWLNSLVVRRQTKEAPLTSTFVAVLEPYRDQSNIRSIRRVPLQTVDGKTAGDAHVAVVVTLGDGREDLLISRDTNVERQSLTQPDWTCTTDADFSVFRRSLEGVKTQLL
jgi:oligo-alginate lyase|uniref:heparinase II/III domain-containing protein n=1 Tax=Cephaloticoccus sp. TaxID=1985742 RepID=UPI0040491240